MRRALTAAAEEVFRHRPLRLAVIALWLAGVGLTLLAGGLALGHGIAWWPYAVPGVVLAVLAAATWQRQHWALVVDVVGLASQPFAAAGALVELLARGGADKVALRALGVPPALGLLANVAYSTLATAVLAWLVIRLKAQADRGSR